MKILLIDNYDSFTYNLVHYLEAQDALVTVWRNDEIDFSELKNFDAFVISPGPGLPGNAGALMPFISAVIQQKPLLGVCLGFQALIEHFGGSIYNQQQVKHGIAENCTVLSESTLFKDVPKIIKVGLYHSWAANPENFPGSLQITAKTEFDVVMAFEHRTLPVFGVQFHPESILTEHGHTIIKNFTNQVKPAPEKR